jgi:hypothetical protein
MSPAPGNRAGRERRVIPRPRLGTVRVLGRYSKPTYRVADTHSAMPSPEDPGPARSVDGDQFVPSGRLVDGQQTAWTPAGRPWLGVRFLCSGAYQRVYRNPAGTAYIATCPRCGRSVRFDVGPGGTSQRFFEVSC